MMNFTYNYDYILFKSHSIIRKIVIIQKAQNIIIN